MYEGVACKTIVVYVGKINVWVFVYKENTSLNILYSWELLQMPMYIHFLFSHKWDLILLNMYGLKQKKKKKQQT